jgi:hypothetical protein
MTMRLAPELSEATSGGLDGQQLVGCKAKIAQDLLSPHAATRPVATMAKTALRSMSCPSLFF